MIRHLIAISLFLMLSMNLWAQSKSLIVRKSEDVTMNKPQVFFGGQTYGDSITVLDLRAAQGLIVKPVTQGIKVYSYQVDLNEKRKNVHVTHGGAVINPRSAEYLKSARPGDILYIHGIKAKSSDADGFALGDLELKVIK